MEMKFYKCNVCGKIVGIVRDSSSSLYCCGQAMEEIFPLEEETNISEKHIPTYERKDNKLIVKVGSILHPMTSDHHISWVALTTNKGNQRKALDISSLPIVTFYLDEGEEPLRIYSYCNIHSLWVLDLTKE